MDEEKIILKRRKRIVNFIKNNKFDVTAYSVLAIIFLYGTISLALGKFTFISFSCLFVPLISLGALRYKKYGTAVLPFIIAFGVFIRIQNLLLLKNKYLIELDTYVFLRYAKYIIQHGTLMANDAMRYVPLGAETAKETQILPYTLAYLYKIIHFIIPNITIEYVTIFFPVIFFIPGIVAFYLFVKEVFGYKIGLIASFFLSIIPSYLSRTIAGFADKEAMAVIFIYLALYFFAKGLKNPWWGLASGIMTGVLGLIWGGVRFIALTIGLFALVVALFELFDRKFIILYTAWLAPFLFMMSYFTLRYGGIMGLVSMPEIGVPIAILFFMIIIFFLKKIKFNAPKGISLAGAGLAIILIFGIIFAPSLLFKAIDKVQTQLLHPLGVGRTGLTVAENRQPYFSEWWSTFGWFFFFFFIGSILLFYKIIKTVGKYAFEMTFFYFILIAGIIFSRNSQYSQLNGSNFLSQLFFFGGMALFGFSLIGGYLYLFYKDKKTLKSLSKINLVYVFVFLWFIVMTISGRGAVRLLFIFAPAAALFGAFFFFEIIKFPWNIRDKFSKFIVIVIIALFTIPPIYSSAKTSFVQAGSSGPTFNDQWQASMQWTRQNTPKNSVFAHWWDYGYWVQAMGERATILDGGNFIEYWNHLMARHVLAAKNYTEAMQFLKVHDATHLLIISDEIGKYQAYSSIGSDENFDIFSWIGTYVMDAKYTEEKENITTYFFTGGTGLDEDFTYDNRIFPKDETAIGLIKIPVSNDELEVLQPSAVLFLRGERTEVPVECVYDDGEWKHFEKEGLKGCLRIFPRYLNNLYQQENGALLYVSRIGLEALWTKLFLFDDKNEFFELVYDDSGSNALAYYYGNVMGPTKIWKINYPKNLSIPKEMRQEYLAITTPEWMNLSQRSAWNE